MAILSSSFLIRLHGFGLASLAFTLVFYPDYIQSSSLVWTFGEALQLPDTTPTAPESSKSLFSSSPSKTAPSLTALIAFVLTVLALSHVFFAPREILGPSKYNVVSFSISQGLNRTWQSLSMLLGGLCLSVDTGIYLITATSDEGKDSGLGEVAKVLADRTLFTACFLEFLFWFYVYTVLKEELIELATVARARGDDWGILGNNDEKVRVD